MSEVQEKSIIVKDRITNPRGEYFVYKRRMTEPNITPQEAAWNGNAACGLGIGMLSTKLNDGDKEFKKKFDGINDEFDKLEVPDEEYSVADADTPTNSALIVGGRTNSCYPTQFDSFCKKNEDMAYRKYISKLKVILKNIDSLMFQKGINKWEDAIITDGITADSIRKESGFDD